MRSLLSLSLVFLAAILSGVAMAAAIDERGTCVAEICLDDHFSSPAKRQATSTSPMYRKDLTNAERLARGLAIKPPTRRLNPGGSDPQPSSVPPVTYSGVIQVFNDGVSLGYISPDPNYWTPQLTSDVNSALRISFSLPAGATSGSQLGLTMLNDNRGTFFGPVVGRDSTSDNIAAGSFNYLYLDPISAPGSSPGSTPSHSTPSFFSTSTGLDKAAESSVWSVNLASGTLAAQWLNTDGSSPATIIFVQSNHVYAGGDPNAFQSRFPAPVTTVTLKFIPV